MDSLPELSLQRFLLPTLPPPHFLSFFFFLVSAHSAFEEQLQDGVKLSCCVRVTCQRDGQKSTRGGEGWGAGIMEQRGAGVRGKAAAELLLHPAKCSGSIDDGKNPHAHCNKTHCSCFLRTAAGLMGPRRAASLVLPRGLQISLLARCWSSNSAGGCCCLIDA